MPRSIEHGRRHGPFDPRFRRRPSRSLGGSPSDVAGWENEGGALRALGLRLTRAGAVPPASARPERPHPHGPAESANGRRREQRL